jgi:glycosyltransferase involved in cell wall biosynthesis
MKVGLISSSDIGGGAPRATYRLFQKLNQQGIDASLVVQRQQILESKIIPIHRIMGFETSRIRTILDRLPAIFFDPIKRPCILPNWVPDHLPQIADRYQFDVINIHLVDCGFMRVETLAKFGRPLVWTLHDMWAFTGGCSYSNGCSRYEGHCGSCPKLGGKHRDLSLKIWTRKRDAWKDLNLTVVTPSQWMKTCAQKSSLLRGHPVECVPNGIDTGIFYPEGMEFARQKLDLPARARIILFGATSAESDPRKGFDLLVAALSRLPSQIGGVPILAAVFGNRGPVSISGLKIPILSFGVINDDVHLRALFSAADVFAAPSREDNLPNTVIESLACGTPVVAFNIGGMPDMIDHERTGHLVKPFETSAFAFSLSAEMSGTNPGRRAGCRQAVLDKFSIDRQAVAYRQVYEDASKRSFSKRI